jgi:restriction system protein
MKREALLSLARKRQSCRLDGYACIGDFHRGAFECDHVSPWTKSAGNVDAEIMIVGQDWSSSDALNIEVPDPHLIRHGFDPKFPTNKNLNSLLNRHFGVTRAQCYFTNVFPFIKAGDPSAAIRQKDLNWSAKTFCLAEIEIVSPQLVICLGLGTFLALMRAADLKGSPNLDQAINSPFKFAHSRIHCVAHTGARGINNRGWIQVNRDGQQLARSMPNGRPLTY